MTAIQMPAPRSVPLTPAAVAAPLAEPTLALRHVSKVYRDGDTEITALHPTTFEVRPGELVAVNGPSGSGKSTLLSIAGALLRPTTGQVLIAGQDVRKVIVRAPKLVNIVVWVAVFAALVFAGVRRSRRRR